MSDIFWQVYIYKIYVKYILNIQRLEKIYFIHFDINISYIYIFSMWDVELKTKKKTDTFRDVRY